MTAKLTLGIFRHLRRVLGIKASYYSRMSNKAVWYQAGRPPLPSQLILSQQFRLLLNALQAPTSEPMHHVAFGPALKDRVSLHTHHETSPLPPNWLQLIGSKALEYYLTIIGADPDNLDPPPTLYLGPSTSIRDHISPIKGTRRVLEA